MNGDSINKQAKLMRAANNNKNKNRIIKDKHWDSNTERMKDEE